MARSEQESAMEPTRPPLTGPEPIRAVLRNVRQILKGGRDRLEANVPAHLPEPASRMARHILRDIGSVARSVDAVISDVAHHVFPTPEASSATASSPVVQDSDLSYPLNLALAAATRRSGAGTCLPLQSAVTEALRNRPSAPGKDMDAPAAAELILVVRPHADSPAAVVDLFAACLAILADSEGGASKAYLIESAADLAAVLASPLMEIVDRRDRPALTSMLAKYSAHV